MKNSLALGTFDGLHIGHQKVINITKRPDYAPHILQFSHHVKRNMKKAPHSLLLSTTMKQQLLADMELCPVTVDFGCVKDLSPEEFVESFIVGCVNAKLVSVGENFVFGANRSGNVDTLRALCDKHEIELVVSDMVEYEGEIVSSTKIREKLVNGDIQAANAMLGRPFAYDFLVIDGKKRGRVIGIPTINQVFPTYFTMPKFGVYASRITIKGRHYKGITNIGNSPTFHSSKLLSETHIIGYKGNLYGKYPKVELIGFIRDIHRFEYPEQLLEQIEKDKEILNGFVEMGLYN
ncbi:MAG TPA: riboflavin biosynthesis protein RibF [Clostridiales bacterium]|nr:riboflavin biosynthesis protein RibF [Clostridiales bacterium]